MDQPTRPLEEMAIEMLNMKRHDWLNHLQVLLGYLTMQKIDDLRPYLLHMVEELKNESRITKLERTDLVFFLLTYSLRYPGVCFETEISEKVHQKKLPFSDGIIKFIIDWLQLIGDASIGNGEESSSVIFSMDRLNGELIIITDVLGILEWKKISLRLDELIKTCENWGGVYHERQKTKREWIVEFTFPIKTRK